MNKEISKTIRIFARQMANKEGHNNLITEEDLIQEGLLCAFINKDKYDAEMGANMETYLGIRIKGAMIDYMRSVDNLPRGRGKWYTYALEKQSLLEQKLKREPRDSEIAREMGISLSEYHEIKLDAATRVKIGKLQEEADYKQCKKPHEIMEIERFIEFCSSLDERERAVIDLTYKGHSRVDIGRRIGVSNSRVVQIINAVMGKFHGAET